MLTSEGPEPRLMSNESVYLAERIDMVGAAYTSEAMAARSGNPVGPALMVCVDAYHNGRHLKLDLMIPVPSSEFASSIREALGGALQQCKDHHDGLEPFARDTEVVDELNRRAGFIPNPNGQVARPRCPGCHAELFADVALRGACLACFPEETVDATQAADLEVAR